MTAPATTRTDVWKTSPPYTPAMAKRRIFSVRDARSQFSSRLDAAETAGEHTIVFRHSRPAVVFVPPDWYKRASELLGEPWDDWEPEDDDRES